jgi:uncharacterized protein (TIGR02646 family)
MRPVKRGDKPDRAVTEYGEYVDDLLDRIDEYCSYCEVHLTHAVEAEHVQPKSLRKDLSLEWTNLLLSCKYCNAPKQAHSVDRDSKDDWYWPDRDNTFRAFAYSEGGVVGFADGLSEEQQKRAGRLRSLVKLNQPDATDAQQRRWRRRREAWDQILRARRNLDDAEDSAKPALRDRIVDEARALGYWSMWMTIFAHDPVLRSRFIREFRGTSPDCFDDNGVPVPRPGGDL